MKCENCSCTYESCACFNEGSDCAYEDHIGLMRNATKEEMESVNNYIKSISIPTGKTFYDK